MSEKKKVSNIIAEFLKEKEIKHVFGIIGSANSHIFDSISKLGYTEIISVHHEQAATMAMQTYYRVTGQITAAIVTAGGGSTNAITGVVSAWADSFPGIIISGQENTRFINSMKDMRMWGIQGYDSIAMVEKVTKYGTRIMDPRSIRRELNKSWDIAGSGRPGPVWIDIPMDIQGSFVLTDDLYENVQIDNEIPYGNKVDYGQIVEKLQNAKRPVLWLGNGIRLSDGMEEMKRLVEKLQCPFLVGWGSKDLISSDHPLNFGSAGVYGQRSANFVLQNSDLVISIGSRLSIPMIGYVHEEFARAANLIQVDIDPLELQKTEDMADIQVQLNAKEFISELLHKMNEENYTSDISEWIEQCKEYDSNYPWIGNEHNDTDGYINSYRFLDKLQKYFKKDQLITTDMGTALLSGHQALKIRDDQRIMTSTGLGEMGFGLPAAIGASFGRNKSEVICLNCDGGMMMNLQELQTMAFHKLPIKLFIFNNDGYLMIKHTQKNLFDGYYSYTNRDSGVACPDFEKLSAAFDFPYFSIKTWEDFEKNIPEVMSLDGAVVCEVYMDPEQFFFPKLSLAKKSDGTIVSPPLEDLSPMISREDLKKNMIIGLHPKSESL